MARQVEIIQHLWCDPCLDNPDGPVYTQAVREVTLAFGPPGKALKPKVLAVCEIHDKELSSIEQWYRELAQDDPDKPVKHRAGRTPAEVDPVAPDAKPFPCAACDYRSTSYGGLKQHIRKHEIGLRGYRMIEEGAFKVTKINKDNTLEIDFGPEADIDEKVGCPVPGCPVEYDLRLYGEQFIKARIGTHLSFSHPEFERNNP